MTRAPLGVAAAVVAAEGLTAGTFGVLELAAAGRSGRGLGVAAGVMLLGYALLLLALARGVWRARPWSRGPVVATQLLQLPVAWSFVGAPTTWVGLALAAAAITVLVCVLLPSSTAVLARTADASRPDEEPGQRLSGHD